MNQKSPEQPIDMYGSVFNYYLLLGYYRMRQNLFTTIEEFDTNEKCIYSGIFTQLFYRVLPSSNWMY